MIVINKLNYLKIVIKLYSNFINIKKLEVFRYNYKINSFKFKSLDKFDYYLCYEDFVFFWSGN